MNRQGKTKFNGNGNRFLNSFTTPEERRAKYRLARSLGADVKTARRLGSCHTPKIWRMLGLPLPARPERQAMLSKFMDGRDLIVVRTRKNKFIEESVEHGY